MKLTGSRKAKLGPTRKAPQRRAPAAQPAAGARQSPPATGAATNPSANTLNSAYGEEFVVDLQRRRDQLVARVAELQWDLGGLVYEMVVRNSVNVDVIIKRAVPLQDADAELSEVERILRMEETGAAGACTGC